MDQGINSRIFTFATQGCCIPPAFPEVKQATENEITFSWDAVFAARNYQFSYRSSGSTNWNDTTTRDTTLLLAQLPACSAWEYRVATVCDTGLSAYSPVLQVRTLGCGVCEDFAYCASRATDSQEEDWIECVQIDSFVNCSGPNSGYEFFDQSILNFKAGESYPIQLKPGFLGSPFSEWWRIWLDLDQDGEFESDQELIYDSGMASRDSLTDTLSIPSDVFSGIVRMRISMQFIFAPDPCGNFQFGEVEDYCVEIDGKTRSLDNTLRTMPFSIYPNPADQNLFIQAQERINSWSLVDLHGKSILTGQSDQADFKIDIDELKPGIYFFHLKSKHAFGTQKVVIR